MGPASRGPLQLALRLLIGLPVLTLIFAVFDVPIDQSSDFSVAQALVLLCALLWDVAMLGALITNLHGRHFPRNIRVLLYLGYVMLVATANAPLHDPARRRYRGVDRVAVRERAVSAARLLLLGIPPPGMLFVVNLGAWFRRLRPADGACRGADTPD